MSHFFVILAELDAPSLKQEFSNARFYNTLIIFGSIMAAVMIGSIGAIVYSLRKKRRRHRHRRHHKTPLSQIENRVKIEDRHERRGRRRRRHGHRPMNPTLAQMGGLPPMRDENTPPHVP